MFRIRRNLLNHIVFGHTLMVAGATRIVEIAMILGDKPNCGEEDEVRSFQYIPPFVSFLDLSVALLRFSF